MRTSSILPTTTRSIMSDSQSSRPPFHMIIKIPHTIHALVLHNCAIWLLGLVFIQIYFFPLKSCCRIVSVTQFRCIMEKLAAQKSSPTSRSHANKTNCWINKNYTHRPIYGGKNCSCRNIRQIQLHSLFQSSDDGMALATPNIDR